MLCYAGYYSTDAPHEMPYKGAAPETTGGSVSQDIPETGYYKLQLWSLEREQQQKP